MTTAKAITINPKGDTNENIAARLEQLEAELQREIRVAIGQVAENDPQWAAVGEAARTLYRVAQELRAKDAFPASEIPRLETTGRNLVADIAKAWNG